MNRFTFLSKELNPLCCSAQFMCRLEFPQYCGLVKINSKTNNSWAVWCGWRKTLHKTPPDLHGSHPFILSSVHGRVSALDRTGEISLVPHQPVCLSSEPAEPAGKSIWITPVTQSGLLWWAVTRPLKSQHQPFCSERLHKVTELCVHSTCCILTFRSRIYEQWVFPRKLLVYAVSFWQVDEISGSVFLWSLMKRRMLTFPICTEVERSFASSSWDRRDYPVFKWKLTICWSGVLLPSLLWTIFVILLVLHYSIPLIFLAIKI